MRIGGQDLVTVVKATIKDFEKDDLQGEAAAVAYHLLFSIVPLTIFLTALTSAVTQRIGVDDVMDDVTEWLRENLPDDTANAVIDPIETILTTEAGGILSFGALTALWGGKNAMAALMKGLNAAFDAEEARPWWRRQLVAIGLTIGLGLSLIATSVVFVVGATGGGALAELVGLGDTWATVWTYLQWPLIAVLLTTGVALLYWLGPNVEAEFKWLTPGSILVVVGWALATFGLSIYFGNFAGYTAYGALGAVMAFIFWLYVMGLILLFGGELNSVLRHLAGTIQPDAHADHSARDATTGNEAHADEGGVARGTPARARSA